MDKHAETFKRLVTEAVADRVANECRAGFPQGGTDRSFSSITGDLIMTDWVKLSRTMLVQQCVDRICGTERKRKGRQHRAQDKRRVAA